MEILLTIISIILLLAFVVTPYVIYRRVYRSKTKYKFINYLLKSILISAPLAVAFVWWGNQSDLILLKHYGYNIDGINDKEFYGNVEPQNLERVTELVTSVMGVGWTLKSIMMLVFCFPYIVMVYFLNFLSRKRIL